MQCHHRPHSKFSEAISKEISQSAICGQENDDSWYLEECAQLLICTHNPAAWGKAAQTAIQREVS